jgi:hypothetical protein
VGIEVHEDRHLAWKAPFDTFTDIVQKVPERGQAAVGGDVDRHHRYSWPFDRDVAAATVKQCAKGAQGRRPSHDRQSVQIPDPVGCVGDAIRLGHCRQGDLALPDVLEEQVLCPSRSAEVALQEMVEITQSLPWPPPGHPPLDVRQCSIALPPRSFRGSVASSSLSAEHMPPRTSCDWLAPPATCTTVTLARRWDTPWHDATLDVQVALTCPSSRHLKHCKDLFGMAVTLAVDQPRVTFPSRANFRAPATGHLIHAVPKPHLVVRNLSDLHRRAAASRRQGQRLPQLLLSDRDVYPATFNTAVLLGAATRTVAGSSTSARRVASRDASCLCRREAG